MSYSLPPFNAHTARKFLERAVVRTGEYVLTSDDKLFDVSELAESVFFNSIDYKLYEMSHDEFDACYHTVPKTELLDTDNRAEYDGFIHPQFIAPLLGITCDSGKLLIIDGYKRARIIFNRHPDAVVTIAAVEAADAEQFRREYVSGAAFSLMRELPLWVLASGEVSGSDAVVFTNETKRGTPPNDGDKGLIDNLVAIRGLEIIRRRFSNEKSVPLADRGSYDDILAGLSAEICGKTYAAHHEARNRHAAAKRLETEGDFAHPNTGKFATWQRRSRQGDSLNAEVRQYYANMGFPSVAGKVLDLSEKSEAKLVEEFVMLSRAAGAFDQNRSGEKFIDRMNKGKEKKMTPDELQLKVIGTTEFQSKVELDLPSLFEIAILSGINPAKFYHHCNDQFDLLQWASQIFFLRHGEFRPLATWGEIHQYLYWSVIHASIPDGQTTEFITNSLMLGHWNHIFCEIDSLKPIRYDPKSSARSAVADICWRVFRERTRASVKCRRDRLVQDLRNLGFFYP